MDIQHFYIEKGQGEPLILLHGNGEDSSYFTGQIDEFSRTYHVFAIDSRGHGKTARGSMPFTIRQFAEDIRFFLDAHQIERAHLLGFSDGGNIAMIFAIRHPDRVEKLILDGANLDPGGVKRTTQLPIEIGYRIAGKFAAKSISARRNMEMLALMVNDPFIPPEELHQIQAKTLVIAGNHDVIKKEHTKLIASSIPGAELVWLKGNHYVAKSHPKEFNRVVLEFLQR